ncbi:MAG TPA: hypothetical protein VGB87_17870 [Vicinamibacteria bacterium]
MTKGSEREGLFGVRWIHVFEEDTGDAEVFRPETADVPLSRRPRRRLELSPDGTARILVPGPDDRLVESRGIWRAEAERGSAGEGAEVRLIRVREHSPARLVVAARRPGRL